MSSPEQSAVIQDVIGIVEYAHAPQGGRLEWCRVRPLLVASDREWEPIADRRDKYPSEGLVYWYAPSDSAGENTAWRLRLSEQFPHKKDWYIVDQSQRLMAFVELRDNPDATDLRRLCSSGSFTFTLPPPCPFFVKVPGSDDRWVGPMEPAFEAESSNRFKGSHEVPSGFLGIHAIPDQDLVDVRLERGAWRVLRPGRTVGGSVGLFNAQTDEQLLSAVLKRLRKLDNEAANALDVTQAAYQGYVRALDSADLTGEEASREEAREQALRLLMNRVQANFGARMEIADALVCLPQVRDRLSAAIDREVDRREEEIKAQVGERASTVQAELNSAESDKAALEARCTELRAEQAALERQLSDLERELQERSDSVGHELEVVAQRVLSKPVQELADHVLVRALLGSGEQEGASLLPDDVHKLAPAEPIEDLASLRGAMRVIARLYGVPDDVTLSCISSLLAGIPVLAAGGSSRICCEAVAQVLSGPVARLVEVPTHVFGVDDMLNLVSTTISRAGGRDAELGTALQTAEPVDSLMSLVLVGVNRAPLEITLESLVAGRSSASRSQAIPWKRRGRQAGLESDHVRVDSRLMILGTLSTGPSTFPLTSALRSRVGLVWTDAPAPEGQGEMPQVFLRQSAMSNLLKDCELSQLDLRELVDASQGALHSESLQEEARIFSAIFGDVDRGLAHWLICRFAGLIGTETIRHVALGVGVGVSATLRSAHGESALRQVAALVEDE